MTVPVLITCAGLLLLYIGGEVLILGAVKFGERIGLSHLVVGLTVVAFATSTPELAVSIEAAMFGHGDVAVGNVIGSNIANIALVLGLAAMIKVLPAHDQLLRRDIPIMLVSMIAGVIMLLDGALSRLEGVTLLVGLVAYITLSLMRPGELDQTDEPIGMQFSDLLESHRWIPVGVIGVGVLLLTLGGGLLVEGATSLAHILGVSEAVIGLTIVSVGTSLPELTTSVIATARGHTDIAIANAIGSNIFNVLLVLGLTAGLTPLSSPGVSTVVLFTMIVSAAVLWVLARSGNELSRIEGGMLLSGYLAFNAWILIARS